MLVCSGQALTWFDAATQYGSKVFVFPFQLFQPLLFPLNPLRSFLILSLHFGVIVSITTRRKSYQHLHTAKSG